MQLSGESLRKVSSNIIINKVDDVFVRVHCEKGIAMEMSEYFTFYVPGYKFMPAFRNKVWDGKIHLFNTQNHQIYYGLVPYIERFCEEREYTYECNIDAAEEFSEDEAMTFIDTLGIPYT